MQRPDRTPSTADVMEEVALGILKESKNVQLEIIPPQDSPPDPYLKLVEHTGKLVTSAEVGTVEDNEVLAWQVCLACLRRQIADHDQSLVAGRLINQIPARLPAYGPEAPFFRVMLETFPPEVIQQGAIGRQLNGLLVASSQTAVSKDIPSRRTSYNQMKIDTMGPADVLKDELAEEAGNQKEGFEELARQAREELHAQDEHMIEAELDIKIQEGDLAEALSFATGQKDSFVSEALTAIVYTKIVNEAVHIADSSELSNLLDRCNAPFEVREAAFAVWNGRIFDEALNLLEHGDYELAVAHINGSVKNYNKRKRMLMALREQKR